MTLVAANLAVPPPDGVEVVQAPTAADLAREVLARADADVIVMAAAVADYRPADPAAGEAPEGRASPGRSTLEPTEDVLAELGPRPPQRPGPRRLRRRRGRAGLERARAKLANKGGNLFVYNDVSRSDIGFESDDNELVALHGGGRARDRQAEQGGMRCGYPR